ncbi:MAG: insulinase family protein [Pseudanabaenales cyanobacterium]|nr:insulinase family protein [Pseudanabaenales cyanobacterium]
MISPQFPAQVVQFDNGLTVIHQEISATPVVVADVWVRAGAIAEPSAWSGMAHFLEHMIFKGTHHLAPGFFDQAIESRGGMTNAATSHDYAHFFLTIAADALPNTLPYLADLLLHASIPADEFVRERNVVLEEIRQAHDDPDWLGFQALSEQIYQDHPYGRPVLGTAAVLNQRSPEEMRCFHQAHYQPDKMTVVLVGAISLERALEMVNQTFRPFAQPVDCPGDSAVTVPAIQGVQRQTLRLPRLEQARLIMAWVGPGVDQLQYSYGLDLLSVLLAEGRTSRLVRDLREERQLVQEIYSSFSLQRDCSLLTINVWLEPQEVSRVEGLICDQIAELATHPIPEVELSRCKRLLCNDYAFSTETPGQLAGLYGYYSTITHPEHCVDYPHQIQSYQGDELKQLASKYLSPSNYVAIELQPV